MPHSKKPWKKEEEIRRKKRINHFWYYRAISAPVWREPPAGAF